MSRFEQMIHACELKTRPRTSWSSSIWPAISCRASKARMSASTSAASKPHATIVSSSTYSLHARLRCVFPGPFSPSLASSRIDIIPMFQGSTCSLRTKEENLLSPKSLEIFCNLSFVSSKRRTKFLRAFGPYLHL